MRNTNKEAESFVWKLALKIGLTGRLFVWAMLKVDALLRGLAKDVREQESIRTRLSALMAMCVEAPFGGPLRVHNRLVLATAHQPSSKPGAEKRPVLLECLGGSFRLTEAEAAEAGIPVGFPRLLSLKDKAELALLLWVCAKAEENGTLERGWSSDPDLHIELGLRASPRRKMKDDRKLSDLVQYRVDRVTDEKRIIWDHKQAQERGERFIEVPMYEAKVASAARVVGFTKVDGQPEPKVVVDRWFEDGEFIGYEKRATGRDDQDADREAGIGSFADHSGYDGVVPLHKPSRDENALLSRDRYRLDDSAIWLCQFTDGYERLWTPHPWIFDKAGKVKSQFLDGRGRIAESGKRFFKLRSSFVPKGQKQEIKYWEKRFFPSNCLQIVEMPFLTEKGWVKEMVQVTDDREVDEVLRDVQIRGECKLAWKGGPYDLANDRYLPHPDVNVLGNEALGMLRGAIESGAYSHIALVPTDMHDLKKVVSRCFGCERKWGTKEVRKWTQMAHAWACPVCGSERARVVGRVWVKVGLLPFLPIQDRLTKVTHVEIAIYGSWLGELINRGLKVDGAPRSSQRLALVMA